MVALQGVTMLIKLYMDEDAMSEKLIDALRTRGADIVLPPM